MANYFVSWSGGKDSCLALHKATAMFGKPSCLLTMLSECGRRSRSHGLRREVLIAQARALNVEIEFISASWGDYEERFADAVARMNQRGISVGVFGDIKIDNDEHWHNHRQWADSLCSAAGMESYEPLWDMSVETLRRDFLASGIKANIVAVDAQKLDGSFLGRELNEHLMEEFSERSIHPMGERGEFHTVVVNSPLFEKNIGLTTDQFYFRNGYWVLDYF